MSLPPVRLAAVLCGCLCVATLLGFFNPSASAHDVPLDETGTHTVGLTSGPFFPIRLMPAQSSKLFGVAAMPSWSMTVTDRIGSSWYQGQVAIGAEMLLFGTWEPLSASGIGLTPKLAYTFTGAGRLRPFVEGGGGAVQPGEIRFESDPQLRNGKGRRKASLFDARKPAINWSLHAP